MKSRRERPEDLPRWAVVLRSQGRTMTWLATVTGKSYRQVRHYYYRPDRTPAEWLVRVTEVLGENVA